MKISTRTRYAARAMAELAMDANGPVSVREVAGRQQISSKYLEHIFKTLTAAGLLRAVRGKSGGYRLARPAETITLRDLFEILEGAIAPVECVDDPECCPRGNACPTHDTWVELKEAIHGVLERTTIQQLAERNRRPRPRRRS